MADHHADELVADILPSLPDPEWADTGQSPAATEYKISTPLPTLREKTAQNLCVAIVVVWKNDERLRGPTFKSNLLVPRDVTVTDRGEQQNVTRQEDYSQPTFSFPTARLSQRKLGQMTNEKKKCAYDSLKVWYILAPGHDHSTSRTQPRSLCVPL